MKTISIFLALINSLFAGVLILMSLSSLELRQVQTWWLLIKILAAGSIIGIGILTWIENIVNVKAGLSALASVYLVALGTSIAVWTVHLAEVTGDMEYYMIIYGGSLFIQGIALLFGISHGQGTASAT